VAIGIVEWFDDPSSVVPDAERVGEGPVMRASFRPAANTDVACFGRIELAEVDVKRLSSAALVDRLVASGISRLSAERMVAIERENAEPGRARTHVQARR
jgi:hypothetical protein